MPHATAYAQLYELSRAIDDSRELEPQLQRFLTELVRRLDASGAAVLESPANVPSGQAPVVCLMPAELPRDPLYAAFWDDWSFSTLETALAECPPGLPILTQSATGSVLAMSLPGFGVLLLLRSATAGPLNLVLQQGLPLVAMTVALAARCARRSAETKQRIEMAQFGRSQRLADTGREIRVPLKNILEISELTLHSSLEPAQRHALDLIRASATTLLEQIDDLLDLTRIETGQMTIEQIPFNPSVLIADLIDALALNAHRHGREICYTAQDALPTHSLGDPSRIRQVLTTLCQAILASSHDDVLHIQTRRLAAEPPTLDWLQISVLGLKPPLLADLQAVLDLTLAVNAMTEHGFNANHWRLASCARLIEHLGGQIWIDAACEHGSLHFSLPLQRLNTREAAPRPGQSWPGKRALIVDNQAVVRRTLAYWFKQWGLDVQEASGGRQALELAQASQPAFDVYVFDAMLPELDGFELAAQLRAGVARQSGALVMLASLGQRGDAQRCRSVGIDAFLTKPASPRELRELLTRLLTPREIVSDERPLLTRHMLVEYRQRLRVLLVESSPLHQKLASALLQEWGHETHLATTSEQAIAQFQAEPYDLVLLDLALTDADGLEVAHAMRRLEAPTRPRTPIIGLNTLDLDSERPRYLEHGLDDYIVKPLNPTVLEDLILRFVHGG